MYTITINNNSFSISGMKLSCLNSKGYTFYISSTNDPNIYNFLNQEVTILYNNKQILTNFLITYIYYDETKQHFIIFGEEHNNG